MAFRFAPPWRQRPQAPQPVQAQPPQVRPSPPPFAAPPPWRAVPLSAVAAPSAQTVANASPAPQAQANAAPQASFLRQPAAAQPPGYTPPSAMDARMYQQKVAQAPAAASPGLGATSAVPVDLLKQPAIGLSALDVSTVTQPQLQQRALTTGASLNAPMSPGAQSNLDAMAAQQRAAFAPAPTVSPTAPPAPAAGGALLSAVRGTSQVQSAPGTTPGAGQANQDEMMRQQRALAGTGLPG